MRSKKRRGTVCHNCDSAIEEEYNFCPACGQSNSDNNITFWILIKEFLDNYLGIDSKMAHSFLPFLLRPGSLTNRFQEGKIKHFIHPVRLYLVLSLFYFFIISFLLSDINFAYLSNDDNSPLTTDLDGLRYDDDYENLSDSAKIAFLPDSIEAMFPEIEEYSIMYDTIKARFGEDYTDNTRVNVLNELTQSGEKEDRPFIERMHILARDSRVPTDVFIDSLFQNQEVNIGIGKSNTVHFKQQLREIFKNDEGFKGFLLGNLPLMMFILIPLFAGVLKMIYIRRSHLYIKHVVHALHVHSFAYLMYGIALLLIFKVVDDTAWRGILAGVFFVGVSTYVYVSFLKVYKQGWFKTLIKFNIVGFVYSIFLQIFFYLEIFISFWYYKG